MPKYLKQVLKQVVPARARERIGIWRYWIERRALPAIRGGINPISFFRYERYGDRRLRVKGVNVQSDNRLLAWSLARDILEDREYDIPGFVPQPGWRVIDVGGNIGLFSMLAASRGARVVAYEPHPRLFEHLQSNTRKWGVECRQAAVTGTPVESVTLYIHPERDIRTSVLKHDIDGRVLDDRVTVPAVSLSEVLADECDLLKVDIEGGEFELFANTGDALTNARRIIAELHLAAGEPNHVVQTLERWGFNVTLHHNFHNGPVVPLTASRKNADP